LALLMFVVWWRLRVRGASGEYSRFSKALRSFGAFLGWALLGPLAVVTLLEASEVRMLELSYGLVAGLLIGEFGRAVAVAVLAPDDPPRRLLAVDDAPARSLAMHLTWGARGLGVLVWAQAIHRALAAPPVLSVATDTVFSLFVAALVLHLLWAQRRIATAPTPKPLRALAWLCVAAIAIAIVAGYPSAASFIAARLVSIVAVLGLLYLLWVLGRELFATPLLVGSPHSVAIAADFGVGMRGLGVAAVLTGLGMVLAALLAAFVIYIGPW
jgi:small-conductance mechanosensitive channel